MMGFSNKAAFNQSYHANKQHNLTYQINKWGLESFIKRYVVEDKVIEHSQSITPLLLFIHQQSV